MSCTITLSKCEMRNALEMHELGISRTITMDMYIYVSQNLYIYRYLYQHDVDIHINSFIRLCYGVALVSRIDKMIGLFCQEPYKRGNILQKRPIIKSILLTVATPYVQSLCQKAHCRNVMYIHYVEMHSKCTTVRKISKISSRFMYKHYVYIYIYIYIYVYHRIYMNIDIVLA